MQDPGCRRSGAPRSPQCLHTRLVDRDWGGSWNVDTNSTGHSLCCNASQFLDALPSLALLCPALPCPACVHRGSPRQGRGRSFPAHVCMYACDACSGLKCSSLNLRRSGGPSRDTLPWSETGSCGWRLREGSSTSGMAEARCWTPRFHCPPDAPARHGQPASGRRRRRRSHC